MRGRRRAFGGQYLAEGRNEGLRRAARAIDAKIDLGAPPPTDARVRLVAPAPRAAALGVVLRFLERPPQHARVAARRAEQPADLRDDDDDEDDVGDGQARRGSNSLWLAACPPPTPSPNGDDAGRPTTEARSLARAAISRRRRRTADDGSSLARSRRDIYRRWRRTIPSMQTAQTTRIHHEWSGSR